MSYQLFDVKGNPVNTNDDLQNKVSWCRKGERLEEAFLGRYGEKLNLFINPDKKTKETAHDFIWSNGVKTVRADLKTQNTPFFKAARYGLEPQYTVTFNEKDLEYYRRAYSGQFLIYFHIEWAYPKIQFSDGTTISVDPLTELRLVSLKKIEKFCRKSNRHCYLQRKNDNQGNAKCSFLIDFRNFRLIST